MITVPQFEVLVSQQPITVFFGGYGSGKTQAMGMLSLYFVSNAPKAVGLIAANTYGQLTRSTLFRIFQVWAEYGVTEYKEEKKTGFFVVGKKPPKHFKQFYQLDTWYNVISFRNGAIIFLASLDNYKSLDGMEVSWMLLDETKDTKRDAMDILIGRLRQKGLYINTDGGTKRSNPIVFYKSKPRKGQMEINPMYVFTAPAKVQWLFDFAGINKLPKSEITQIRDELFNHPHYSIRYINGRKIIFAATQTNIENLPKNYVENMQRTMPSHIQEMLIWGFPFGKEGGEFYKYFSEERHVGKVRYNPNLPIHISFDENVVPYAPCGVWQVEGKTAFKIDEIDLRPPKNNIYDLTQEILKRYGNHKAGVFIYGDATSRKRDEKLPAGQNFYEIVRGQLSKLKPVLRVPRANPKVKLRADFINAIHEKEIYGIKVIIGDLCENSINDYKFLKEAADGTKLKVVEKDPVTQVTFQKYGHDSDLDDYFLCEYFKEEFNRFLRGRESQPIVNPLNIPIDVQGGEFMWE